MRACHEPAASIIKAFGGDAAVASLLKLSDRTIPYRWRYPRPRGTGGVVPWKHVPSLLRHGRAQGVRIGDEPISERHFVPRE